MTDNRPYYGDNLDIPRRYIKDEGVDLIYLDPPFNRKATYNLLGPQVAENRRTRVEWRQEKTLRQSRAWPRCSGHPSTHLVAQQRVRCEASRHLAGLQVGGRAFLSAIAVAYRQSAALHPPADEECLVSR